MRLIVDEKDPVGIPVEGEAHIRAELANSRLEVDQVLGLDRVRRVMRKGAVELGIQHVELARKPFEDRWNHQAAHAVRRVGNHLERTHVCDIDERTHVVGEGVEHIGAFQRASLCCVDVAPCVDGFLNGTESGVGTDRSGGLVTKLDAVVLGGVVTGGEHRPGAVQTARREIQHVGRCQTDRDDVGTSIAGAFDKCLRKRSRGFSHVTADDDGCTLEKLSKGVSDRSGERRVDLAG